MDAQYFLTHYKALKPIIKEMQEKMSKLAILQPQFDPYRGGLGKFDLFDLLEI